MPCGVAVGSPCRGTEGRILGRSCIGSRLLGGLVLCGPLTRQQEGNELHAEDIAHYVLAVKVIVQHKKLGSDIVEDALFTHEAVSADEKIHQHVVADVLLQNLLHGSLKTDGVKILVRRNVESTIGHVFAHDAYLLAGMVHPMPVRVLL